MDMYLIIRSILPFYRQFRSLTGEEDLEAGSILLRLRLCYEVHDVLAIAQGVLANTLS